MFHWLYDGSLIYSIDPEILRASRPAHLGHALNAANPTVIARYFPIPNLHLEEAMRVSLFTRTKSKFPRQPWRNERKATGAEMITSLLQLYEKHYNYCRYECSGSRPLAANVYYRFISTKSVFACICLCLV